MDKSILVTTLFVDIGGVLLTDGWGHEFRKLAVKKFHLNQQEMEDRHQMVFETFELDKLTMEEYLKLGICHTDYKSTCEKLASFGLEVET